MSSRIARHTWAVTSWAAIIALGACEARGTRDGAEVGRAPGVGDTAPEAAAPAETGQLPAGGAELSDANIVALLDEANKADSTAGALAADKATDPDVKAFARLMMREHHALRVQGQQLAKQLNITPAAPADDPVQAAAEREMQLLRSTPKGAGFDRAYIEQEVAIHEAVLDLAGQAHEATDRPELKELIETARPILEKHRDRAQEIQRKLGEAAA